MSLTELTTQLSKIFDECLNSILTTDPQQKKEQEGQGGLDTQINTLKASFLELESQFKEISLNALQDAELSTKESNKLLKRDIDIKQKTINKYAEKLCTWETEIPFLIENSKKAVSIRTDGTDFDSMVEEPAPPIMEGGEIVADEMPITTQGEDMDMPTVTPTTVPTPLVEPITTTTTDNNNEDDNEDDDDDDDDDDVEFEEV